MYQKGTTVKNHPSLGKLFASISSIFDTEKRRNWNLCDPSLENWRWNWATRREASSKRLLCDLLSRVLYHSHGLCETHPRVREGAVSSDDISSGPFPRAKSSSGQSREAGNETGRDEIVGNESRPHGVCWIIKFIRTSDSSIDDRSNLSAYRMDLFEIFIY